MKLYELRQSLKSTFLENNIETEDVDFIIAEVLQCNRTDLFLINDITDNQERTICDYCKKRLEHIPVTKLFKKSYFYGLEFKIDDNVLSPRQESEILVETALKSIKENNYQSCLDLCTGSGCLAISIAKNADIKLTASDISPKAIAVAKKNADFNNVKIEFVKSDMFDNINDKFDIIVSNPPYIDSLDIEELDEEVKSHDPKIALDGGDLGLRYYSIIHENVRKYLNDNGILIMEIGEDQKMLLTSLFTDWSFVDCIKDYAGHDRVLVLKK